MFFDSKEIVDFVPGCMSARLSRALPEYRQCAIVREMKEGPSGSAPFPAGFGPIGIGTALEAIREPMHLTGNLARTIDGPTDPLALLQVSHRSASLVAAISQWIYH